VCKQLLSKEIRLTKVSQAVLHGLLTDDDSLHLINKGAIIQTIAKRGTLQAVPRSDMPFARDGKAQLKNLFLPGIICRWEISGDYGWHIRILPVFPSTENAVFNFFDKKWPLTCENGVIRISVDKEDKDEDTKPSFKVFKAASRDWALGDGSGEELAPRLYSIETGNLVVLEITASTYEIANRRGTSLKLGAVHLLQEGPFEYVSMSQATPVKKTRKTFNF